jgi:pimeloyl-ACP methyl ester carboxylesterase
MQIKTIAVLSGTTKENKAETQYSFGSFYSAKPAALLLLLSSLFTFSKLNSQGKSSPPSKPTIVLVHGLWADGSCWNKVMGPLLEKGYNVIAVQNPTTSIEDDLAATQRAIERAGGDVILVGHSWGGFVISEAGNNPNVKALVYVAALCRIRVKQYLP